MSNNLFEDWYAGEADEAERARMFEKGGEGSYKLMGPLLSEKAFTAGMEAFVRDLVNKYETSIREDSCDVPAFEKILLHYMENDKIIELKENIIVFG
jgi:hypothetical protein